MKLNVFIFRALVKSIVITAVLYGVQSFRGQSLDLVPLVLLALIVGGVLTVIEALE